MPSLDVRSLCLDVIRVELLLLLDFSSFYSLWSFNKKIPSCAPRWSVFRQENGRTLKVLTHKPNIITSQTQQPFYRFSLQHPVLPDNLSNGIAAQKGHPNWV